MYQWVFWLFTEYESEHFVHSWKVLRLPFSLRALSISLCRSAKVCFAEFKTVLPDVWIMVMYLPYGNWDVGLLLFSAQGLRVDSEKGSTSLHIGWPGFDHWWWVTQQSSLLFWCHMYFTVFQYWELFLYSLFLVFFSLPPLICFCFYLCSFSFSELSYF